MKTIRIGAIDYKIKQSKHLWKETSNAGEINYIASEICLDKNLSKEFMPTTVWHEIIHGLLFNGGYPEHDEQMVSIISNGIVQVLRDNPDLLKELA